MSETKLTGGFVNYYAAARLDRGKPGHKALYDAEKMVHYGNRLVRRYSRPNRGERNGQSEPTPTPT